MPFLSLTAAEHLFSLSYFTGKIFLAYSMLQAKPFLNKSGGKTNLNKPPFKRQALALDYVADLLKIEIAHPTGYLHCQPAAFLHTHNTTCHIFAVHNKLARFLVTVQGFQVIEL